MRSDLFTKNLPGAIFDKHLHHFVTDASLMKEELDSDERKANVERESAGRVEFTRGPPMTEQKEEARIELAGLHMDIDWEYVMYEACQYDVSDNDFKILEIRNDQSCRGALTCISNHERDARTMSSRNMRQDSIRGTQMTSSMDQNVRRQSNIS